ncbi:MAG: Tfp pilus assembly protein FimT/FimU [Candidatus Glassbacteria bacterium]
MTKRCKRAGFTLVELIIVLIIMAIALGIVAPFMAKSFDKYRLRETSRALSDYLRKSREVAIKEGIKAAIYFDEDGGTFQTRYLKHNEVVSLNIPLWFELIEGMKAEIEVNDPIGSLTGEPPHFVFFPMGNAVGGTVRLSLGEDKATIIEIDDITGGIIILKDTSSL